MGAKTAMTLALQNPEVVNSVVSVDNAPVDAVLKSDFGGYVKGMRLVEEKGCKSQREADEVLQEYAPVGQLVVLVLKGIQHCFCVC